MTDAGVYACGPDSSVSGALKPQSNRLRCHKNQNSASKNVNGYSPSG